MLLMKVTSIILQKLVRLYKVIECKGRIYIFVLLILLAEQMKNSSPSSGAKKRLTPACVHKT